MFYLEKSIKFIILLPSLLSILGAVGFILYKKKHKKAGRRLLYTTFALSWFFSTEAGAKLITCPLISNLEPISAAALPQKANILVLGGGCRGTEESGAEQLSLPSLRRTIEGVRIKQYKPDATLILSGTDWQRGCDIADIEYKLITQWTDSLTGIQQLNPARNTREEAALYYRQYGNKDTLILVTSALHINRAIRNFNKYNISIIPAPTDFPFHSKGISLSAIIPDPLQFNTSTTAWTEWIAMLAGK